MEIGGRVRAGAWAHAVAVVVGLALTPVALASTTVSGDKDSNAPLIVDPASSPADPLTLQTAGALEALVFVQRMPVTKTINALTVGDIGRAAGCTGGTIGAQIWKHDGSSFSGATNTRFYASAYVSLPAQPSKVTWSFPATTLHKGQAYSFRFHSSGGCPAMRYTTWSHDQVQVESGPLPCEQAPIHRRMWHVSGLDDAQWACVSNGEPARRFKPGMPGGWLVSHQPSAAWDIMGASYLNGSDPDAAGACSHSGSRYPRNLGAYRVDWQATPAHPLTHTDYICKWSQFAPPGVEVEDGWFYAIPWPTERNGMPRSMYLELDTIDYDALLDAHSPIVMYDGAEAFRAMSPSAATDFFDASDDPDDPEDANRLVDENGAFASANSSVAASTGIDTLDLEYLGDGYPSGAGPRSGTNAAAGDYLSHRGSSSSVYFDDASDMEVLPGYGNQAYGRAVHDSSGHLWLQYWLYYYFDPQVNFLGSGEHEGDWEMVQIRLSSGVPDQAAYAQHGGGEVCPWSEVPVSGERPIVYVAGDSHASYFRTGTYTDPTPDERADGLGGVFQPDLNQIWLENIDWLRWPGVWGDSGSSPDGPAFQGSKWTDPGAWAGGLSPCDVD